MISLEIIAFHQKLETSAPKKHILSARMRISHDFTVFFGRTGDNSEAIKHGDCKLTKQCGP